MWSAGGPDPPNTPQLPLDLTGTEVVFSFLLKTLSSLQDLVQNAQLSVCLVYNSFEGGEQK